jgi:hypothetical protein
MLTNWDIQVLLHIMCSDLNIPITSSICNFENRYYAIPMEYYEKQSVEMSEEQLIDIFAYIVSLDSDYQLYIKNLSALHRRRVKYYRILATQMKSDFEQISPRSLLEYGIAPSRLLCNWMLWRKWIYDIDNRSAQETGYLFEPIVAACMGGIPVGSRCSPVKRVVRGVQTHEGRQIDCYIPTQHTAYELKLRVTIAASGQGRWGEELSFPSECRAAGIMPNLLVLDPTPNPRLLELAAAYESAGGAFYLGDNAWRKMENEAGRVMGLFLKKYIRPPLQDMCACEPQELHSITLSWDNSTIEITSDNERYIIRRKLY